MSDQLDRERLKELCAKATPGPWRGARDPQDGWQWWGKFPKHYPECVVLSDKERVDDHNLPICCTNDDGIATEQEYANAQFIAAARTALPALIAENERLEGELAEARKPNQRLYDLVRHQRMELHEAELVTDEEYIELAKEHSAVARLEDYDAIRLQLDQARLLLDQARKRCETLAGLLKRTLAYITSRDPLAIEIQAALASEQEGKS